MKQTFFNVKLPSLSISDTFRAIKTQIHNLFEHNLNFIFLILLSLTGKYHENNFCSLCKMNNYQKYSFGIFPVNQSHIRKI
jgi:hypothetical protein